MYILKTKKECINDMYNKIKLLNRHVIGVPKEDERERDQKKYIFEAIMTQFSKFDKKKLYTYKSKDL